MSKIRNYTIFRDSKSGQYRVTYCFCMERLCDKSSSHGTTHNANMITEERYEIDIPVYIEKDWISYEYNPFVRGYHAYMNIWNPFVGKTLKCRQEPSNKVDKNAVAIIRSGLWEKETIVGHVPQNFSKTCSMFLKFPNTSIEFQVVGKRLNHGGGYSLGIPVIYRFYGQEKLVNWLIKKDEAVKKELECKVFKCLR